MKHLLAIADLSVEELLRHVENAESFLEISERDIKKVPALRGKTTVNLFFEPSTRTRTSFEIAAKRLSADAININASASSASKGETLLDTALTLQEMRPDVLVLRHSSSGAGHFLARFLEGTSIVNAGDGQHEHPTQALLDLLTLKLHRAKHGKELQGLEVSIVGDVRHSRVARSLVHAHLLLGNRVRLVGPRTLVPDEMRAALASGAAEDQLVIVRDLQEGIRDVDCITVLRLQRERQGRFFFPNTDEYCRLFGLNLKRVEQWAPEAIVMHPGPANRGIEISSDLMASSRCVMSAQVRVGVAVRMAVLFEYGRQFPGDEGEPETPFIEREEHE